MGTIGGNVANASPAGDTIPALVVLQATVSIASIRRVREVPIIDFFTGPGRSVLKPDELVTEISFRGTGPQEVTAFGKLGSRQAMTISTANVAVFSDLVPIGTLSRRALHSDRLHRPSSVRPRPRRCSGSCLQRPHGMPSVAQPRWRGKRSPPSTTCERAPSIAGKPLSVSLPRPRMRR